jgi:hypothetical protein
VGFRERLFGSGGGSNCSTDDFEIRLPKDWKPSHEPTHYGFVREQEGEQVTISAQRARARLDKPTLFVAALEVVAARQNAFRSLSGGKAAFSEPESTDVLDGMDVTFGITDTSAAVQGRVWVLARPHRIVTLTFLRYEPLVAPDVFLAKGAEIRGALELK